MFDLLMLMCLLPRWFDGGGGVVELFYGFMSWVAVRRKNLRTRMKNVVFRRVRVEDVGLR